MSEISRLGEDIFNGDSVLGLINYALVFPNFVCLYRARSCGRHCDLCWPIDLNRSSRGDIVDWVELDLVGSRFDGLEACLS